MPAHQTYLSTLQDIAERSRRELNKLVPRRAELGRVTEEIIRNVLQRILPKRFSLGTGFVINSAGKISAQTDIVIYDNFYNSPLLSEFGAHLFPVECVYATIEVKSVLTIAELRKTLADVMLLREVGKEKHYVINGESKTGSTPPRSYVVSFGQSGLGRNYQEFCAKLIGLLEENNSHIHGVCLLKRNWFAFRKPHQRPAKLIGAEWEALMQLYRSILLGQDNFQVYPMNIEAYLGKIQ